MQVDLQGLDEHIEWLVEQKVSEALGAREQTTWYSARRAAEYLDVAIATIYDYVNDGKLTRHGAKNTRLRFRREDLDALVAGAN